MKNLKKLKFDVFPSCSCSLSRLTEMTREQLMKLVGEQDMDLRKYKKSLTGLLHSWQFEEKIFGFFSTVFSFFLLASVKTCKKLMKDNETLQTQVEDALSREKLAKTADKDLGALEEVGVWIFPVAIWHEMVPFCVSFGDARMMARRRWSDSWLSMMKMFADWVSRFRQCRQSWQRPKPKKPNLLQTSSRRLKLHWKEKSTIN